MKTFSILLVILSFINNDCFCQQQDTIIYTTVDSLPKFEYKNCKSNKESISLYISEHQIWPSEDDVDGKVFIQFVVEKDGTLTNFEIVHGIEESFDRASINILKSMPAWKPGKKNELIVRTLLIVPVKWSFH